jgi:hypothetical protein
LEAFNRKNLIFLKSWRFDVLIELQIRGNLLIKGDVNIIGVVLYFTAVYAWGLC